MKTLKTKVMMGLFWKGGLALSLLTMFGGRCPAEGCPACKIVGK